MVLQIDDFIDCLQFVYPQFDFEFEINHSSGHSEEQPDGISTNSSVINLGWGRKERRMRSTVLTKDDVGTIIHARKIVAGSTKIMAFQEQNLPPIFDPTVPKYDEQTLGEATTRTFTKAELRR